MTSNRESVRHDNASVSDGRPIKDFSDEELCAYADEHVLYEITHFVRAVQAIKAAEANAFPMNFALEVFALHLRNLLDFFAPRSARKTDATAADFCGDWEKPALDSHLQEGRWKADKHVAHLTTDRTSDINLKLWAVDPTVQSLIPAIKRFTERAELVSEEFRTKVAERLRELPAPRSDRPGPSGQSA